MSLSSQENSVPECVVVSTDGVATNYEFWCETHDHGSNKNKVCLYAAYHSSNQYGR